MADKNNTNKECLPKLATGIRGLDKLLYDGINVNTVDGDNNLLIVIKGDVEENDKTLLGMQILYGLAQSIESIKDEYTKFEGIVNQPVMYSTYYKTGMLQELFLDYFISSGIQEILRKKASKDNGVVLSSNKYANLLFDCKDIKCKPITPYHNIPFIAIEDKVDSLIGDGIVYYNNRTNSLHFKVEDNDTKYNLIYERKTDLVNLTTYSRCDIDSNRLHTYTGQYAIPFHPIGYEHSKPLIENEITDKELLAIDISDKKNVASNDINHIFDQLESAKIGVLVVDSKVEIPEHRANIIINLSSRLEGNFLFKTLQITKSDLQDFMPGLHQYKKRDYGIEVYPRLSLYIVERRYLQNSLVYTHASVLNETYQQYQKRQKYYQDTSDNMYEDYEKELDKKENDHFRSIYPKNYMQLVSIDLLNKIFMPLNPLNNLLHKSGEESEFWENEYMYGNAGFVTAVIGEANTYKRFLTFGGIFGSAATKDHTLIILMNKEESMIRRRLTCPARPLRGDMYQECNNCYKYIHFMNICMGNITAEEFLYYLEKQIEVTYDGSLKKRIRRIVIDDMQILDFCFPQLKKAGGLFLAALAEMCRIHDIILYVLCDRNAGMLPALRALADNVVLTKKDEDGHPLVFVEKFAGYSNTPSKMYCGKVKNIYKLFRCVENFDSKDVRTFDFQSNIVELEDMDVNAFMNNEK